MIMYKLVSAVDSKMSLRDLVLYRWPSDSFPTVLLKTHSNPLFFFLLSWPHSHVKHRYYKQKLQSHGYEFTAELRKTNKIRTTNT
jgi:hypothetical protein